MWTPMHLVLELAPVHLAQGGGDSSSTSHIQRCGSLSDVNDIDFLRSNRISYLIHPLDAPWLPFIEKSKSGFTRYRIDILHSSSDNLKPHLEALLKQAITHTSNLSISASTSPSQWMRTTCHSATEYLRVF
ncbi:hypothetical protein M378DRAFT_174022 [Amanita muscaria Koide BX008]|uniref:Uncharacterized protein n=1 Tax=Amanita muscaria (strain Koide BX008) TaxID=946122 RepID=A0A0C2RWV6_AMAMK|nr:hypothetical protein M378DRAFT_174022 [Amanita muscaria Koide BX008]